MEGERERERERGGGRALSKLSQMYIHISEQELLQAPSGTSAMHMHAPTFGRWLPLLQYRQVPLIYLTDRR